MERYCVGCAIEIERPFWLCQTCEAEFGVEAVDYRYWPKWLKALKMSAAREEYEEDRGHISLDDDDDGDGIVVDTEGNVYGADDRHRLRDSDLMRYAPYADEAMNRAYRQANDIKERQPSGIPG